jgi:uncharacterized protein YciI
MKHFLLFYDYAPDYLERRGEMRASHLDLARAAVARGELILGGALTAPADMGVLLWRTETDAPIRAFAEADPYVTRGLVTSWRVREWITVVGASAVAPVK